MVGTAALKSIDVMSTKVRAKGDQKDTAGTTLLKEMERDAESEMNQEERAKDV